MIIVSRYVEVSFLKFFVKQGLINCKQVSLVLDLQELGWSEVGWECSEWNWGLLVLSCEVNDCERHTICKVSRATHRINTDKKHEIVLLLTFKTFSYLTKHYWNRSDGVQANPCLLCEIFPQILFIPGVVAVGQKYVVYTQDTSDSVSLWPQNSEYCVKYVSDVRCVGVFLSTETQLKNVWTRSIEARLLFVMWHIRIKVQAFVLPILLYSPVQMWPFPILRSVKQALRGLWEHWKDRLRFFMERYRQRERCWVYVCAKTWWQF